MSEERGQVLKDGPVPLGDGLYVVVLAGRIVRDNNKYRRFTSLQAAQQFIADGKPDAIKQGGE